MCIKKGVEKLNTVDVVVRLTKENVEIREKALVAYDKGTSKVLAIGNDCEALAGNVDIEIVEPFKEGKIADYNISVLLFKGLLLKAYEKAGKKKPLFKKSVGICTGSRLTEVERKAFEDSMYMGANARDVLICEMSYQKMMEESALYKIEIPEVLFEIGIPDEYSYMLESVVQSINRIMDIASDRGISSAEVIDMYRQCLDIK